MARLYSCVVLQSYSIIWRNLLRFDNVGTPYSNLILEDKRSSGILDRYMILKRYNECLMIHESK